MGFLFGPAPIRRTLPYLKAGRLLLRQRVQVLELHYNMFWRGKKRDGSHVPFSQHDAHIGLREFYFWDVPQIQYMNPSVQIVRFIDMSPNPFIRGWLASGADVLFDCDSQSRQQILQRLVGVLGKTEQMIQREALSNVRAASEENQAIFGVDRARFCMCEVPGQCPCPSVVKLPKSARGKYTRYLKEDTLREEKEIVSGAKEVEDFEPPFIAKMRFFNG